MDPLNDQNLGNNINYDQDSKPPMTDATASDIIRQLYGIDVNRISELNAYDDRNYYVLANDQAEYVLKITNSVDTAKAGLLEGQN